MSAPNGVASLASGTEILLKPTGKERIFIRLHASEAEDDVGIRNTGSVKAIQAEIKADGEPLRFCDQARRPS